MKNIFKSLLAFLALFVAGSCNFIDSELNVDPNNPADVSINLLLPQAQATWAYVQGGDLGRYASCWTQHHSGQERQHQAIEVYNMLESDVNNVWTGIYASTLKDLSIILEKAEESKSPHYAGIAKVMTAMAIGSTVDYFGDVPFSDALKGAEQLKPAYDTGADIYTRIQGMLDEAINDLQAASSTLKPDAKSDLVFGGDLTKWVAFAKTLKARHLLHLSKIDNGAYGKVLAELDGAISSNDGNAMFNFGAAATEANPWQQFEGQRGDVIMGKFFIDLLNSINDPRLPFFATPNAGGEYIGAGAGVFGPTADIARFGPYYASSSSPVPFGTYAETKFIEAEAAFASDKARAADALNAAIIASVEQVTGGTADPAYVAAQASETANSVTLEKIMTHKYIAMYTTLESLTDWRRTGLPNLQPAQGNPEIARRFPYPQDERVYNAPNYKSGVTVFDRVFWDN
jgi:hypothetical protein